MPTIKKETIGTSSVWTLRNTKGNELKVTDLGARLVSMRFRDRDFKNRLLFKNDTAAGVVLVDGGNDFTNILWKGEETLEGLKLSTNINGKSATVTYSLSNDNEISIKYETTGIEDISTQVTFSADAVPDVDFRACQKGANWEKLAAEKIYSVTETAEVEMELGMFGYDPGCPIDYLNAGLKNAANLFSESAGIEIIVYATQNEIHAQTVDGGFALWTGKSNVSDGKIAAQTVYMIKSRK